MFCLPPIFTNAAGVSLSAQPAQIEYSGKPGAINKGTLSVINKGNTAVKLKIRAEDFRFKNENGDVEFYIAASDSALTWLIPQFLEITLPAFGTKTVEYIISIPKGTKAGGHLGAITFEVDNKKFGTLFYLNVIDSGITTGGTITNFSTPRVQFSSSPKLNLTIKNLGNANLAAKGSVAFTDWRGNKVAQFETDSIIASPENSRSFGIDWRNDNLFGFYKAKVDLVNSTRTDQKFSADTWFIVLPWQKMAIFIPLLLAAAAIIFFIIFFLMKNSYFKLYS